MFSLEEYAEQQRQLVDASLQERMPAATERPAVLHEAMRYGVFSGGKRLRPLLCLAAAQAVGGKMDNAILPACAIEVLHTYSLIHDDLPAMDDDDERRGQPTCHIKFGEANAILAGDALLTLAFEWMGESEPPEPYTVRDIIGELARAAGSRGIVAGQVEDMAAGSLAADAPLVEYIHQHKTADLLTCAARVGGMCGGATPEELSALSAYGQGLGHAFQLTDDILDADQKDNLSAVAVYGIDGAIERAAAHITAAKEALTILSGDTQPLTALADFIVTRTK